MVRHMKPFPSGAWFISINRRGSPQNGRRKREAFAPRRGGLLAGLLPAGATGSHVPWPASADWAAPTSVRARVRPPSSLCCSGGLGRSSPSPSSPRPSSPRDAAAHRDLERDGEGRGEDGRPSPAGGLRRASTAGERPSTPLTERPRTRPSQHSPSHGILDSRPVTFSRFAPNMKLVVVHTINDAEGGCEFEHFFSTAPPDLVQAARRARPRLRVTFFLPPSLPPSLPPYLPTYLPTYLPITGSPRGLAAGGHLLDHRQPALLLLLRLPQGRA